MKNVLPNDAALQSLRIEKLVYGGEGLARPDGRVVLTPYVLPGEMVRATVRRAKNDLFRGTPEEIVQPAPQRVQPPCPYFTRCGGCHLQHTSYEHQVEQKRLILLEVLRRVGRIEFDRPVELATADPLHYRNRTQLHIHKGTVGYFAAGSHFVIAIDQCPISSPRLNEAIGTLVQTLPDYRGFEAKVELFTNETQIQVNVLDRIPLAVRPLFDALGSSEPIEYDGFRVSRNSFFQVNRFLVNRLVELALGDVSGSTAVDLYAGVGLFARAMIARFEKVSAIEPGASAYRDLQHNLQDKASVIQQTAEDYLASLSTAPEWVLADPPRAGLGKIATRELLRLIPARLTIVSCDPATLARDLRILLDGGYKIVRLAMADLFPQTYHLETVVELGRRS